MRIFFVAFLSILLFPISALSQVGNDSLYNSEIERIRYLKHFLKHNLSSATTFGEINLNHMMTQGNFKLAQEPFKRQEIDFYAIGANEIKKFRVSGDFRFNKIYDDSLAFGQRNENELWTPYHYYAAKAGNYERQNYQSKFTLSYKLTDWIRPFINVYYSYHWTTGSVDPRFDNKSFVLKYSPGVYVRRGGSTAGVNAVLGKGYETQNISYKNTNYKENLLFPDRIHYLSLGYGNNAIKDTANARKYKDYIGAEMTWHQQLKNKASLDLGATFINSKEEFTNDPKATHKLYRVRGIYHESNYGVSATFLLPKGTRRHYFSLNANYLTGHDFLKDLSPNLDKTNYEIDLLSNQFSYLAETNTPAKFNFIWGLELEHFDIHRRDYASVIDVANSNLQIQTLLGIRIEAQKMDQIKVQWSPLYRFSLSDQILYSENALKNYIRNVVFWDYEYYKAKLFASKLAVEWRTRRISKKYLLGIKGEFKAEKGALSEEQRFEFDRAVGTLNRNRISIGVNLYL